MAVMKFAELEDYMAQPEMQEETVKYLAKQLKQFLKQRERVLICFPGEESQIISDLLERAVVLAGGSPLLWGPDYRWKTLLKLAFASRATVFIGLPNVALGLMKLAKATSTPLYLRNVLTAGYPCVNWMIEGIRRGLDCISWGCFNPGNGSVVAGFSCGANHGVHLREELFDLLVLDEGGSTVVNGEYGELALVLKTMPGHIYKTREYGKVISSNCQCGHKQQTITGFSITNHIDTAVAEIYEQLHSWTSILDCRVHKGKYGLELEIVKFPGEKLPKLPSCAKLILRSWNPEQDTPFSALTELKNSDLSWESY